MASDLPILFHAGTQKTGTTAIQGALAADRARLAAHGVLYPEEGPGLDAHNRHVRRVLRGDILSRLQLARRRQRLVRAQAAGLRVVMSAEAAYRAVLHPVPANQTEAWFASHVDALRRLRQSLGPGPAQALLVFRSPEAYAVSLYKERVARWRTGRLPDLPVLAAQVRPYFLYTRQISAFEAAFDEVLICHYEAACSAPGGILSAVYTALGLPAPEVPAARQRGSLSNPAVRWLQTCSDKVDRRAYQTRVLFALHGAHPGFAEAASSSLWPSPDALAAFRAALPDTYGMAYFSDAPDLPPAPFTPWSAAQQDAAERAFASWAEAHGAELARRRSARTPFFQPMDGG